MNLKSKKTIVVVLLVLIILSVGSFSVFKIWAGNPETATVTLQTPKDIKVNEEQTVPLFIDTFADTINAAEVYIKYDPEIVDVKEVTKDGSFFKIWVTDMPRLDQKEGMISYAGGLPKPGFKGRGQIGTVKFVLKKKEQTQLTFTEKTRILKNDGQGSLVPLSVSPVTI